MTQSDPSRLDRIEQILERLALRVEVTDQQIALRTEETDRQIASNAKAIEANSNALAETRRLLEESGQRTSEHIEDLTRMFFSHVEQADADRAEMRRMIEEMYGNRSNGNGDSEEE